MFVLPTVLEILSGQFTTIVLDQLVLTRFPIYYCVTFTLLGISLISGASGWMLSARGTGSLEEGNTGHCRTLFLRKFRIFTVLVTVSLTILLSDYFWVYLPLEQMLTPIGSPRPQQFPFYHKLTESLNVIALVVNLMAAAIINWPLKQHSVQSA